MIQIIVEAFQFSFFSRAFIVGILLAITYGILGNFVVMRDEAIIGHSMANLVFLGIAIATLFDLNINLLMILTAVGGVFFINYLQKHSQINQDSILALTSQLSIAGAILVLSQVSGYQNIEGFLFGNILAVSKTDFYLTAALFVINILILIKLYRPLVQLVINKELAISNGNQTDKTNFIFMLLLALSVALGIKIIGVILLAAFLVIPANIGKNLASNLKEMMIFSNLAALIGVTIGLLLSYALDIPSGASIVVILGVLLIFSQMIKRN